MGANYVEPAQLAEIVRESQRAGRPSDALVALVTRMAAGLLGRHRWRVDCEDATQEAMLALVANLDRLDPEKNLFSYLTSMIQNSASQLWHRDKRQERMVETLSRHCDKQNPNPVVAARHAVMPPAPPPQKQKNLRWLASLSPEELAAYRERQHECRRRYAERKRQQKQKGPGVMPGPSGSNL